MMKQQFHAYENTQVDIKGSDDGIWLLESLGLWALSIASNSKWLENTTVQKHDLLLSSGDRRRDTYSIAFFRKN
jgi:hypothetical protein